VGVVGGLGRRRRRVDYLGGKEVRIVGGCGRLGVSVGVFWFLSLFFFFLFFAIEALFVLGTDGWHSITCACFYTRWVWTMAEKGRERESVCVRFLDISGRVDTPKDLVCKPGNMDLIELLS